jgi:hypothetical protein
VAFAPDGWGDRAASGCLCIGGDSILKVEDQGVSSELLRLFQRRLFRARHVGGTARADGGRHLSSIGRFI